MQKPVSPPLPGLQKLKAMRRCTDVSKLFDCPRRLTCRLLCCSGAVDCLSGKTSCRNLTCLHVCLPSCPSFTALCLGLSEASMFLRSELSVLFCFFVVSELLLACLLGGRTGARGCSVRYNSSRRLVAKLCPTFPPVCTESELHGNVPGFALNLQLRQTLPCGFFVSGELSTAQVCNCNACLR